MTKMTDETRVGYRSLAVLDTFLTEYVRSHTKDGRYFGDLCYITQLSEIKKSLIESSGTEQKLMSKPEQRFESEPEKPKTEQSKSEQECLRKQILVVDDEPGILKIVSAVLADHGYETHQAESGKEALDIYRKHHANIAGIVTDIMMPGMSGVDLYHEILKINPGARVLFVTGYDRDLLGNLPPNSNNSNYAVLKKPFRLPQLKETLDSLIN